MSFSLSNYSNLSKNFDPALARVAGTMDEVNFEWFVIAGWALDLFIGRKTREHKDIEISIWRDEVFLLLERFPGHRVDRVIGHKRYEALDKDSTVDSRGHLILRDFSLNGQAFDIELFTTERQNNEWVFRKQNEIRCPLEEAILTSSCGTRYLAPQFVLLYKAWFFPSMEQALQDMPSEADFMRKCWETDCRDFQTALPLLAEKQREQLRGWLQRFTPGIPWLASF